MFNAVAQPRGWNFRTEVLTPIGFVEGFEQTGISVSIDMKRKIRIQQILLHAP